MKRYLYLLLCTALATACAREVWSPETEGLGENLPEGLTVPVIMHFDEPITLHAETRADANKEWGVNPKISSIHVAVFGWGGYLQDYITAEPCDAVGNPVNAYATENANPDAGPTNYFLVRLPVNTDGRRTCHIIANGPDNVDFAYDTELMKELTTTDGNSGYWQWIYLPNGILPKTDPDGEFIKDVKGNLLPSDDVMQAFSNISLIRNFASITVDVLPSCKNFKITGWTICQMPLEGSFAPFSSEWETNNMMDGRGYGWLGDYATEWSYNSTTAKVERNGGPITYDGFPTSPRIDTKIPQTPSSFNAAGVAVPAGELKFIYERAVTSDSNPFLLIEAKYLPEDDERIPAEPENTEYLDQAPTYYYRMDIAKDGEYVPFYRNYAYQITIRGASVDGYATPALAARHNSGDNFSLSLDTATLSDVSDGITRLYTERSNFTFTYDSESPQQSFEYDFIRLGSPDQHLNSSANVTVTVTGNAIMPGLTWGVDPNNADKGRINYTLEEPDGDEVLSSTIKIEGVIRENGNVLSRLVRTVTVVVFNKMHVNPRFDPQIVSAKAGEETTLIIPLYLDLPWTLFPLQLRIEDTKKTLNPSAGSDIPVQVGPLMENEKSTFYYVYTLNYSDYLELNADAKASGKTEVLIPVPMTTILDENETTARVWNEYFALQNHAVEGATPEWDAPRASLLNDDEDIITPNTATVAHNSTGYNEFTVKSSGNWILSVSREHGAAATGTSISPSSGIRGTFTGVTVTFPENNTLVERKYILTLTNLDDPTIIRTAEITQEPAKPSLTAEITDGLESGYFNFKGNDLDTQATITVTSNCDWEAEITEGADYAEFVTSNVGYRNGTVTVRMKAKNYNTNGATGRPVKVTFRYTGGTAEVSNIKQKGLFTSQDVVANPSEGDKLSATDQSSDHPTRSLSLSGTGIAQRSSVVSGRVQYIASGTFTASGSGPDFCSVKSLEFTYMYYLTSMNGNIAVTPRVSNDNISNSINNSTWSMPSTITENNAVTNVTVSIEKPTAISSDWRVTRLTATYYYWN